MKKILFISAHPDDETLGCGGTILKHKHAGDQVNWLILTGPTPGHPHGFAHEKIERRKHEIKTVAEIYGFHKVINLEFPTQMLDQVNSRELIMKIDEAIKEIKPEEIYVMNRSDVHSDHRIGFHAVYSCCKGFRKPWIERLLMYECLSETEFSPALNECSFIPNVFIDITDHLEKKLQIMAVYESEVMPDNLPRSFNAIRSLAAFRGTRMNVKYAEAFVLLFEKNHV